MRYDWTPLWRSTIGFDRLFDVLDEVQRTAEESYPPYNIERLDENHFQISVALAGFTPDEVALTVEHNVLTLQGRTSEKGEKTFLHRGISARNFKRQFTLADHVEVKGARFENGLLVIELQREIPEAMKPRRIEINGAAPSNVTQIEAKAARLPDQAVCIDLSRAGESRAAILQLVIGMEAAMRPTTALHDNVIDLNALLHPGTAFEHPRDVVSHPILSLSEKRAILASWASDASAIASCPSLRASEGLKAPVAMDEILEALCALDEGPRNPPGGKPMRLQPIERAPLRRWTMRDNRANAGSDR